MALPPPANVFPVPTASVPMNADPSYTKMPELVKLLPVTVNAPVLSTMPELKKALFETVESTEELIQPVIISEGISRGRQHPGVIDTVAVVFAAKGIVRNRGRTTGVIDAAVIFKGIISNNVEGIAGGGNTVPAL